MMESSAQQYETESDKYIAGSRTYPGPQPYKLGCSGSRFHLGRVHGDGSFRNDDAEVFDRSLVERAFLGFEEEVVFLEAGEDIVGKGVKEWQGGVEEENIIEVDDEMAFIDKVGED